jgi:DNA-directed RNA polymerase subunit RPC12/RpoP
MGIIKTDVSLNEIHHCKKCDNEFDSEDSIPVCPYCSKNNLKKESRNNKNKKPLDIAFKKLQRYISKNF